MPRGRFSEQELFLVGFGADYWDDEGDGFEGPRSRGCECYYDSVGVDAGRVDEDESVTGE